MSLHFDPFLQQTPEEDVGGSVEWTEDRSWLFKRIRLGHASAWTHGADKMIT